MSPAFLTLAQGFKIAVGLAQAAAALWFVTRSARTRVNLAFALAFGTNGIGFAIWNFARPGSRTPHSLALEGRGVLDWIATSALMLFALLLLHMLQKSHVRLLVLPLLIAVTLLVSDIYKARGFHVGFMGFGGLAIYVAAAFALALLALIFASEPRMQVRTQCALFSAALSINYADHIGASIIRPGSVSPATIQLGGMRWDFGADAAIEVAGVLVILGVWLWNVRASNKSRMASLVAVCLVLSFLTGVLARIAAGSYRGLQESGFFGLGLIAATALLVYGVRHGLFSASFDLAVKYEPSVDSSNPSW